MPIRTLAFSGFESGRAVAIEAGLPGHPKRYATVESWAEQIQNQVAEQAGHETAFGTGLFRVTPQTSVAGDLLMLDVTALPASTDYDLCHIEVEHDDGLQVTASTLDMWVRINYPRLVRAAPGATNSYRVRLVDNGTPGTWTEWVSAVPLVGPASVTVTAGRTQGTAPAGILFEATATGFDALDPFRDLRYKWSFDDTGTYDRVAPDYPWSRTRDLAYGPSVYHAFPSAGTYNVTCEVTDGTTTVTSAAVAITIDDPDTVFAGNATICIGSATGAPTGAQVFADAASASAAVSAADPVRVLVERGTTTANDWGSIRGSRVMLGAYGTGADPVITSNVPMLGTVETIIHGVDMQGPYDAADPFNQSLPIPNGLRFDDGVENITLEDVRMSGWKSGMEFFADRAPIVVVSNCDMSNWWNYGIGFFGITQGLGICGSSVKQNPLAHSDADKDEQVAPFVPDHGPVRIADPKGPVYVSGDLFSANSWGGTGQQTGVRWNTGGSAGNTYDEGPGRIVFDRYRTEGGQLGPFQPVNGTSHPQEILIDKCHHILTSQSSVQAPILDGGSTYRNLVLVQENAPPETSTGLRITLRAVFGGTEDPNVYSRIEAYNVTIVDFRTAANSGGNNFVPVRNKNNSPGVVFDNVIYHAPNDIVASPGNEFGKTHFAPFDLTSQWTPSYVGRRITSENGGATQPEYANTTQVAVLPVPQTGSAAVGTASGKIAIDDFFGNIRPTNASQGAFEPG